MDLDLNQYIDLLKQGGMSSDAILETLKAIKASDNQTIINENQIKKDTESKAERRKKFSLFQRNGNPVYYVEYRIKNGNETKIVKRSTTKTDKDEAQKWALENMSSIIKEYEKKQHSLETILLDYYQADSEYLKNDNHTRKELTNEERVKYMNAMKTKIIPFFKSKGIYAPYQVDKTYLEELRLHLLKNGKANNEGLSAKSANTYMSALRRVFNQLTLERVIERNPFSDGLDKISRETTSKKKGSFTEIEMKQFLRNEWEEENYNLYMLCVVGYYTGLRNEEIIAIQPEDIFSPKEGYYFLKVRGTKTENAERYVPVCDFLLTKINEYIEKNNIQNGQQILNYKVRMDRDFHSAYVLLGKKLGYTEELMKEKNITFYSLRHLYKTILTSVISDNQLVEYFMGHSEGRDVRRSYFSSGSLDYISKSIPIFEILNEA